MNAFKSVDMKNKLFILIVFLEFSIGFCQQNNLNLIVGTYTKSCQSDGIYTYSFDTNSGDFRLKSKTENIFNPSYLTISEDNHFLYSVNQDQNESSISSYGFNSITGKLTFLNSQNSKGANPCYIINDTKNVIVANYTGGSIAVFSKNSNGTLAVAKQVIQHYGSGPNKKRQESPHVHMVQFSPDKKFVFANDLGKDKMYVYKYDATSETKVLSIKDSISVKPGSGPRHLTFSPNGKFVYLLQELDGTLTIFKNDMGLITKIEETSVVASEFNGDTSAADIHISPDGRYLYATNRGTANDISCFKIQKNGRLLFKERTSTLGKGPRNFTIDPTGNFLLVGHQYTNNIVIFKINKQTGSLADSGKSISICSPVCLLFTK